MPSTELAIYSIYWRSPQDIPTFDSSRLLKINLTVAVSAVKILVWER